MEINCVVLLIRFISLNVVLQTDFWVILDPIFLWHPPLSLCRLSPFLTNLAALVKNQFLFFLFFWGGWSSHGLKNGWRGHKWPPGHRSDSPSLNAANHYRKYAVSIWLKTPAFARSCRRRRRAWRMSLKTLFPFGHVSFCIKFYLASVKQPFFFFLGIKQMIPFLSHKEWRNPAMLSKTHRTVDWYTRSSRLR